MTAIFKNGGRESQKNAKNCLFEIPVPYSIYTHTKIISLDEAVINVRRKKMLAAILKIAAKSIWDQKEKMEKRFLSSIYYLEDFKTCCEVYTQKYAYFTLADVRLHQTVYYMNRST